MEDRKQTRGAQHGTQGEPIMFFAGGDGTTKPRLQVLPQAGLVVEAQSIRLGDDGGTPIICEVCRQLELNHDLVRPPSELLRVLPPQIDDTATSCDVRPGWNCLLYTSP